MSQDKQKDDILRIDFRVRGSYKTKIENLLESNDETIKSKALMTMVKYWFNNNPNPGRL